MTPYSIEARLDYFDPGNLPAQDRYQITDCWRRHYREYNSLILDAHQYIIMVGGKAREAVGALELAQTELDIMTKAAGLLAQAQGLDAERGVSYA